MPILFDEANRVFTIQTPGSTYQMKAARHNVLLHTYYGSPIDTTDMSYLIPFGERGFSGVPNDVGRQEGYSLDVLPQEYPCYGTGDFRGTALAVRHSSGALAADLRYVSHTISKGKYTLPGLPAVYAENEQGETLCILLKDTASALEVKLYYGIIDGLDIIARAAEIVNRGDESICLERALSCCVDFVQGDMDWITFHGKWALERQLCRQPLNHGRTSVGSVRGSSSHHYNPFVIACGHEATEDSGSCYGMSFVYSGNFTAAAEVDAYDQTRLLMGIHDENFNYILKPGESFFTPEVVLAYSGSGLTALSQTYHQTYRHHLCRGKYKTARRPVLLNNWEGTYFDFNGQKLIDMAKTASELGVELFVMDDGWFGKRNDDNSGLGDWVVNEEKLGCTLRELAAAINQTGLKFGIWFEPECISEDSDLYRAHPDWAIQIPGRGPVRGRNQLILDFSRAEVRDYIYNQMRAILEGANIEYIKWDFNRNLTDVYSAALPPERQGEVYHRFVLGVYEVLEKLISQFPNVLFEGCSGGGGRFDAGMLYYTPQIWCSDDSDAIERLIIQYGTSFGYPVSTMGAHVSACPNHQTGRTSPLNTRGIVAMSGTFGYELDVNNMTQEEKEMVKEQIQTFDRHYSLIQDGLYYRLTSPLENAEVTAWEFAAQDGSQALLNVVCTHIHANAASLYVKLRGLDPDAQYAIEGREGALAGSALMNGGLLLPCLGEYEAAQFYLRRV